MNKSEKQQAVTVLREKLEKSSSIYLTDFTGLTVAETNELRDEFHNAKVEYKVIKNTLLHKALSDGGSSKFAEQSGSIIEELKGPTGVIFAFDDAVIPAKILKKFNDKIERPKLKLAVVENVVYDKTKLNILASIPSKPEIISSIIGSLHSPISGIVYCINAVMRDLGSVIEEAAKKKAS